MSEDPTQLQEFLAALQTGAHDADLEEIEQALDYRQKVLAKRRMRGLALGSPVKFTQDVKPKYLAGLPATVVAIDEANEKITVATPDEARYRKYRNGERVRCPLAIIEPVQ